MSGLEGGGYRLLSRRTIVLTALGALLGAVGCDRHIETARAILEAHAESYAECERRKADVKEQIEQHKREILALAAGDASGDSAVSSEATQAMLKDLMACNSEWASGVNRALSDAEVPDPIAKQAISDWLEARQSRRPDDADPP